MQFLLRAEQHEINGQHHAVVVLHEVAGVRVEGGDFIEVAVEGERAGASERESAQGLESEFGHEINHPFFSRVTTQDRRLRGDENHLPVFHRHTFEAHVIGEEAVLKSEPFEVFERQRVGQIGLMTGFFADDDGEAAASGVGDFPITREVARSEDAMFLAARTERGLVSGGRNQAVIFFRPSEEISFLASAENFSAAERRRASWSRSSGKVARR